MRPVVIEIQISNVIWILRALDEALEIGGDGRADVKVHAGSVRPHVGSVVPSIRPSDSPVMKFLRRRTGGHQTGRQEIAIVRTIEGEGNAVLLEVGHTGNHP